MLLTSTYIESWQYVPVSNMDQAMGETPMIPVLVDRNWYQRYWLDESSRRVQAPLLRALIGIAGKRILRMFRPMRNGTSASVHAGVPSSRGDTDR